MKNKKLKMQQIQKILFVIVITLLISGYSYADGRLFNYTYQSNVLSKGAKEIEIWTTAHLGRKDYYRQLANRLEFEIGLGSRWQTAFYVNLKQSASFDSTSKTFSKSSPSLSFSNEWKYKISDAVANGLGSALYFEYGVAAHEFELEAKIILDKKINKTTHAFNAVFEPEWEKEADNGVLKTAFEINFEFDYGISFNINKHWNLGVEVRSHNEWRKEVNWEHSALFAGPTVSYSTEKFWVNFTVLPQITKLRHHDPNYNDNLILDEHERLEMRIIFSFVQ